MRDLIDALSGMSREVIHSKNFAPDAAEFLLQQARAALAERNEFRIALSGGNTPRPVYAEFARIGRNLPWEQVHFTFSDERCVPPDDEQSNFRMANETLFRLAPVPEKSIARMRGEIDPQLAAQEYQDRTRSARDATRRASLPPRSHPSRPGRRRAHGLSFPGTEALEEKTQRVVANFVPKLSTWRLTFTFPLISQARHICFLVNANKQPELIESVLAGDTRYPAARVDAPEGQVTWIIG